MFYFKIIAAYTFLLYPICAWDLSGYNISSNYYVSSITTYGTRTFLALPRSSCYNNISIPTLVEVGWFNDQQNIFLRKKPFFLDSQSWNNCDLLQDAVSIDVEIIRSRLWVLDKGNSDCSSKIVIYNLFQKINYTADTPEIPQAKLNFLIVDNNKLNGPRAYVGLDGADYLLIFSLSEFKWWQVNLQSTNDLFPISTKFLTLSRRDSFMYVTGEEERGIYSVDLQLLRKEFTEDTENFNATFIGEKLGLSTALVADLKDGLSYYLPRDYVVIRWDMRYPSEAEYYNVLAQSYEQLPYVSQLYTGPQNGIWALVNYGPPNTCNNEDDSLVLKKRLVKILKYNIFM